MIIFNLASTSCPNSEHFNVLYLKNLTFNAAKSVEKLGTQKKYLPKYIHNILKHLSTVGFAP